MDAVHTAPKYANKRQSNIEKQVTLEDQAICGALQTLNEEAMEDVLDERESDLLASSDLMCAMALHGYNSSNMSTCSDPAETDVLYLQTSVVPDLHFTPLGQSHNVLWSRGLSSMFIGNWLNFLNFILIIACSLTCCINVGFTANEDSVSIRGSLASLAERGTGTPVRQRTVTEVVIPEQISAFSSGLRSRLSSNTSLFRAGSQKSVVADPSYALDRRGSQRSVSELVTKPSLISIPAAALTEPDVNDPSVTNATGGWRSEQGSPRRPASLVLTDSDLPNEWLSSKPTRTESSIAGQKSKLQPEDIGTSVTLSSSPASRFATTNVELLPEQVLL